LSILKNLRMRGNPVPVVLLSARSEPHEGLKVPGLPWTDKTSSPRWHFRDPR
jgi:hypothetical protein